LKQGAIEIDRPCAGGAKWEERNWESGQDWDISGRDKLEKLPSFRTVNT